MAVDTTPYNIDWESIPGDYLFKVTFSENLDRAIQTAIAANQAESDASEAKANSEAALSNSNELRLELSNHITSRSAHGANGQIIGSNDFATLSKGGIVLLAAEVEKLDEIAEDLGKPPIYYSENYARRQSNALIMISGRINAIITAEQNAKQMDKQ